MKTLHLFRGTMFLALLVLVLTGCSENERVVTTRVEASFASTDSATKASLAKALAALKAGDHASALSEFETLARGAKLTSEQRDALRDVMTQVKRALADTAKEAVNEAGKSLETVKDSLPK